MYCKNCGTCLSDVANFCTKCGTKVEEQEKITLQQVEENVNNSVGQVEERKFVELPKERPVALEVSTEEKKQSDIQTETTLQKKEVTEEEVPELNLDDVFEEEPQTKEESFCEAVQQKLSEADEPFKTSQMEPNTVAPENLNMSFQQQNDFFSEEDAHSKLEFSEIYTLLIIVVIQQNGED